MGVRRGVTVSPAEPATNQDIVLDMHLDMTVPVTIDSPISFNGSAAPNELYAWLDLGAEGFIPNPHNWGTGTSWSSSISTTAASLSFPHFPQLEGSNFIFMNRSAHPDRVPYSVFFRRQPGDLSLGATVGPMLPTPTIVSPSATFDGTVEWVVDPGPTPDIHQVRILRPTALGAVTVWSMVLPGSEAQVTLPPPAVQQLREAEAGNVLFVLIVSSRSPKFAYNQWTYDALSAVTWSSFTVAQSGVFLP
jgi:hypothetical protein